MISVTETTDRSVLKRWMLKPSILAKTMVGLPPMGWDELNEMFDVSMSIPGRHFLVTVDGAERGVILAFEHEGCWDLHLCLETWYWHTRPAVKQALDALGGCVNARYHGSNRAVTKLLDDLGFGPSEETDGWLTRVLTARV